MTGLIRSMAVFVFTATIPSLAMAEPGDGGNSVGGHAGVAVPLWTSNDGTNRAVTVADDTLIEVPLGITIRRGAHMAIDFELRPVVDTTDTFGVKSITVHPGLLYTIKTVGGGLRLAFDSDGAVGMTPLLFKRYQCCPGHGAFIEFDLPVRWQEPTEPGPTTGKIIASFGVGIHVGLYF